jgi:hypothetical protein
VLVNKGNKLSQTANHIVVNQKDRCRVAAMRVATTRFATTRVTTTRFASTRVAATRITAREILKLQQSLNRGIVGNK